MTVVADEPGGVEAGQAVMAVVVVVAVVVSVMDSLRFLAVGNVWLLIP